MIYLKESREKTKGFESTRGDTLIYGGWIHYLSFKIEIKFFKNKSSIMVKYFDFKIRNFRK